MDDRPGIMLRDLDRGMGGGGGRAADQQRNRETTPLHFLRDMHHLIERWRDEPGKPDHIRAEFDGLIEDLVACDHHAHVGDLEAVAGKHHSDNVLADVMDVALDGGDQETPGGVAALGDFQCLVKGHARVLRLDRLDVSREVFRLLRFHVGEEPCHRLLHHPGGFHHLRQEHFPRAEQIADHAHAIHQRPLDDLERPAVFHPGLFGVLVDEAVDAFQQRVFQPFLDRFLAPRKILFDLLSTDALVALGQI